MGKITQWAQGIHEIVGDYNRTCVDFTGLRHDVIRALENGVRQEEEVKNDIIAQARAEVNDTASQRLADPTYFPPEYEKYRGAEKYHKRRYAIVSAILLTMAAFLASWGRENTTFVTLLVVFVVVVMGTAWAILRERFAQWRKAAIAQTKISSVVPPEEQREITQRVKQQHAKDLERARDVSRASADVLDIITTHAPRSPYVMDAKSKKAVMQSLNTTWIEEVYGDDNFADMNLPDTVTFSVISPEPLKNMVEKYTASLTEEARDAFARMTAMMSALCEQHPEKVVEQ